MSSSLRLLVVPVLLTTLSLRGQIPPPRLLFGGDRGFPAPAISAEGVLAVVRDGHLEIDADTPAGNRGLVLALADGDHDLSRYRHVEAEITNRGKAPLIFTLWALSGNGWGGVSSYSADSHDRENLAPGQSAVISIDLWGRYSGLEVFTTAANPASVRWLAIQFEQLNAPIAASIGAVRALGIAPAKGQDISGRILVPDVVRAPPAAGRRVYQQLPGWSQTEVTHVLTLPRDWAPNRKFPVIVEYTGNRFYHRYCYSTGRTDQGNLAYGLSKGEGYICLNLPFISFDGRHEQIDGWGDIDKTIDYCLAALDFIGRKYGADLKAVFFTGFSRGAYAGNYLALRNDRITRAWCGWITLFNPGERWVPSAGRGWHEVGIGWNDRAARLPPGAWFYQPSDLGLEVHADVEFLEDRPSTVLTRKWMRERLGQP